MHRALDKGPLHKHGQGSLCKTLDKGLCARACTMNLVLFCHMCALCMEMSYLTFLNIPILSFVCHKFGVCQFVCQISRPVSQEKTKHMNDSVNLFVRCPMMYQHVLPKQNSSHVQCQAAPEKSAGSGQGGSHAESAKGEKGSCVPPPRE